MCSYRNYRERYSYFIPLNKVLTLLQLLLTRKFTKMLDKNPLTLLKHKKISTSYLKSLVIVIVPTIICFATLRNPITWHYERVWGGSGDFCQRYWNIFLDAIGEDQFVLGVCGTTILTFCVYWICGGLYTFLDVTNAPAVLRRYKVQPGTNEPVDSKRLLSVIRCVLFNQIVVAIPLTILLYYVMRCRGIQSPRELPTFNRVLLDLAVSILFEELGFYYSHRLFHTKYFYKRFHKKHHEWTSPIAVTASYCHPLEHVLANVLPLFLGVLVMGSHVVTIWLWFSLAIMTTLGQHSGYHFPFLPSPEAHDYHHLKFNNCYGVLGLLDRFHGTDVNFRSSSAYARDVMLINLMSAREIFPDTKPSKDE